MNSIYGNKYQKCPYCEQLYTKKGLHRHTRGCVMNPVQGQPLTDDQMNHTVSVLKRSLATM